MATPLGRIAQVSEASHQKKRESAAVPVADPWNVYVRHLVVHIMDPSFQWGQKVLSADFSAEPSRAPIQDIIRVVNQINLKKPSRCATAEEAVNCMRLCARDAWLRYDLLCATLTHIQTETVPNSIGSDTIWEVEMLDLRNLMGQLRAVDDILRVQAAERLTATSRSSRPTPLLRSGAPPR